MMECSGSRQRWLHTSENTLPISEQSTLPGCQCRENPRSTRTATEPPSGGRHRRAGLGAAATSAAPRPGCPAASVQAHGPHETRQLAPSPSRGLAPPRPRQPAVAPRAPPPGQRQWRSPLALPAGSPVVGVRGAPGPGTECPLPVCRDTRRATSPGPLPACHVPRQQAGSAGGQQRGEETRPGAAEHELQSREPRAAGPTDLRVATIHGCSLALPRGPDAQLLPGQDLGHGSWPKPGSPV